MKHFFRRVLFLLLVLLAGAGFFLYGEAKRSAEQLEAGQSLANLVALTEQREDFVPYDQLPPFLLNATVSIEDRRFYEHEGVDPVGFARAVLSQFVPGMVRSGGSTISQQVVKNLYGRFDSNLSQKLAEIFLSEKLNELCSKQEILALYVNIINYGDNHIGIGQAAQGYFGTWPLYLTEGQCAILAGIPNSPANLQLSDHYTQARERERLVLQAMAEAGYITEADVQVIYESGVGYGY